MRSSMASIRTCWATTRPGVLIDARRSRVRVQDKRASRASAHLQTRGCAMRQKLKGHSNRRSDHGSEPLTPARRETQQEAPCVSLCQALRRQLADNSPVVERASVAMLLCVGRSQRARDTYCTLSTDHGRHSHEQLLSMAPTEHGQPQLLAFQGMGPPTPHAAGFAVPQTCLAHRLAPPHPLVSPRLGLCSVALARVWDRHQQSRRQQRWQQRLRLRRRQQPPGVPAAHRPPGPHPHPLSCWEETS